MSLKLANQLFREGKIQEALLEYQKIDSSSITYQQAQFNIGLIESRLGFIDYTGNNTINGINEPLVSFIMPIFNVAPYLEASVMSVLNQSYQNIELIIVDDGSTDNSADIVGLCAIGDSRIKVVHVQTNTMGGVGVPANMGMGYAQGYYLMYIDGDDILDKYAVQKMVESALTHQADIVIADFQSFHNDTTNFEQSYDRKGWVGIPLDEPFLPKNNPKVFRLSPVPWRKLYKLSFLSDNNIRFPEGDYFYEDNVLHWLVLSQAKKVVLLDYVVAYHRIGREGQTTKAVNLRLLSHFNHLNVIKNHLLSMQDVPIVYWRELVDFAYRVGWVVDRQEGVYQIITKKRYAQTALEVAKKSGLSESDILKIRPNFYKRCEDYSQIYNDLDLSIVISIGSSAKLLPDIMESLLKLNLRKDIFLISNSSDDDIWQICQRYTDTYKNVYCIFQSGKSLGSIRNLVIPLLTGHYAYFMNADIFIESKTMEDLVQYSILNQYDLVFFKHQEKYCVEYVENSDNGIWAGVLGSGTKQDRKILASQLNSCFWNRIIKVSKLHNEGIFFGNAIIYDNVPYHWHTVISAEHIGFFDRGIYSYPKCSEDKHNIVTGEYDAILSEVHRYTHSLLRRYDDYNVLVDYWYQFVVNELTVTKNIESDNEPHKVYYERVFIEQSEMSV